MKFPINKQKKQRKENRKTYKLYAATYENIGYFIMREAGPITFISTF